MNLASKMVVRRVEMGDARAEELKQRLSRMAFTDNNTRSIGDALKWIMEEIELMREEIKIISGRKYS